MIKLKTTLMKFIDIFRDDNTINEKSVVGFMSFGIMILFAIVNIISGAYGHELQINDNIFNAFTLITLGAFGISEIGKFANKK